MDNFVFGPVPSRRLGFSLGVDLIPRKHCSFDCIYCQVGRTTHKEVERRSFADPALVIRQVMERLEEGRAIDFISLSGSGEPSLSSDMGLIIGELKRRTTIPVAVITNGSLLFREDVRCELALADLVLPSLDAAGQDVFERVNRPHESLSFDLLVSGLKAFRKAYKGRIWLEIMLINDINDTPEQIEIFKQILPDIGADRVQLNTVTRPPVEETAMPVENERLGAIARHMGQGCEVIAAFDGKARAPGADAWQASLVETLKRRSLSLEDVVRTTGVSVAAARSGLDRLVREGRIKQVRVGKVRFYTVAAEADAP
jgi:wyosine [tRNA(Phe)-imidazoG37] synthetase (radical SAM superfamily)